MTGLRLLMNLQPDIVYGLTDAQEQRLLTMTFADVRALPTPELQLLGLKLGPRILLQNGRVYRNTLSTFPKVPPTA